MKPRRTWTILLLLALLTGCGYGEVSGTAYEYSQALYSIANRKSGSSLPGVSRQIDRSLAEGQLSRREARWLQDIVVLGHEGKWDRACQQCRRMMEDQLEWSS